MGRFLENKALLISQCRKGFILSFLLIGFTTKTFAQYKYEIIEDSINEIKLINKDNCKYFTAESVDESKAKAIRNCYPKIFHEIHKFQAAKNLNDIDNQLIIKKTKILQLPIGNLYKAFAYLDITFVEQLDSAIQERKESIDKQDIIITAPVKVIKTNTETHKKDVPEIIKRLLKTDSYTDADWMLSNAKSTGRITDFTKYRLMDNPDICYLLIIDKDLSNIISILSPKEDGIRKDVRTGEIADMKQFSGYAAICIKM